MKYAIIEGGVTTNIAESNSPLASNWVQCDDTVHIGDLWDGHAFSKPPVKLPTVADYTNAVQAMLDAKAHERNYDGILSACTYATSTVPQFKAEGQACINWRDAVWAQCYTIMAQVQGGQLAPPTVPGLLAMLPAMVWPA